MKEPLFPPEYSTYDTAKIINYLNAAIKRMATKDETEFQSFYMDAAIQLSEQGPQHGEGGPFGALLVKMNKDGMPYILGIGANHVLPDQDPTAHAEVTAIRDAVAREMQQNGSYDLTTATLYTSCECCPMCLGAAYGVGVNAIYFANTREQAATIAGFADEAQYILGASPLAAHATFIETLPPEEQTRIRHAMATADAMLMHKDGTIAVRIEAGHASDSNPLALPGMEALREAAKEHGIDLQDYTLVLKNAPSLPTAIAADWAKIGRNWDPQNPLENLDKKNPHSVIYLNPEMESIRIPHEDGLKSLHDPQAVYAELSLPPEQRLISTTHLQIPTALKAFENWRTATSKDANSRY